MSTPWFHLTTRIGESIISPSVADMRGALEELFQGELHGFDRGDDEEHLNTWLTYGFDDGPLYDVDVYSSGKVILSKYRDADYNDLEEELTLLGVTQTRVEELWQWLASGQVERVRSAFLVKAAQTAAPSPMFDPFEYGPPRSGGRVCG